MQTIKTAAIVILLMTVIYGAYVSLTTPPEPLPDEVHQMLVESDEFDIDAGFPDSLGSLDSPPGFDEDDDPIAIDSPAGVTERLSDQAQSGNDRQDRDANRAMNAGRDRGNGFDAAAASDDLLDGERLASLDGSVLPPVGTNEASVSIDQNRAYPSTGGEFVLPDPDGDEGPGNDAGGHDAGEDDDEGHAVAKGDDDAEHPGDDGSARDENRGLANAIRVADEQYGAGRKKEALATLSLFYDTPDLSPSQRGELLSRLDPLAREVIYSQSHLLEQPRRVRHKETLVEIASEYQVPWQLLANINHVDDPITVLPGTDLKVVRGPFRADVSLSQGELTLFLGDYYAGRFPVGIGGDPEPELGTFTVQDKRSDKTFYDASGNPVPPESENNPYGAMWLDLGGQMSIHGSPDRREPTTKGCISLSGQHAGDLFGILSRGSSVVVRR